MSRLDAAMKVIEAQEDALFKIAFGRSGGESLSRKQMMEIAKNALPRLVAANITRALKFFEEEKELPFFARLWR